MHRISRLSTVATLAFSLLLIAGCGDNNVPKKNQEAPASVEKTTPLLPYTIVKKFPHDTTAFTEGLLFHQGKLLESTGAPEYLPYARSSFGWADLEKGKLEVKAELDKQKYFGEGIVVVQNNLYQLTYTNQVGFIYDATTFQQKGQFSYANKEGWGLTTDGKHLIMSDGTNRLTFLDAKDQHLVKTLEVTENGYAADRLNELEYIKGYIYANVWMTNSVVKIDPANGQVVARLELDELTVQARANHRASLEMNGIAYDSLTNRVLLTGKFWPYVYEISFEH